MIPSVIASQVERGIQDYLRTTFPLSNPFFRDILERLFEERDRLFKGPYISVNLPFHTGSFPLDYFESFTMKFPPYVHQEKAFLRLGGEEGRSTLIATGTGSGKTECFLYPLLDYCYRHRGEPGIKAILIYPMNALAVNQATRIAQTIYNNPGLRGNVTAGLFVGMGPGAKTTPLMAQDMVVTHQEVMRNSPPDILLTNYKMLDYLLIRPKDYGLWKKNSPHTLKYLVVDELHTFDGAQGTDLACLLRRLKARVKAPEGYVCCVGTSATLGGKDDTDALLEFAQHIFAEPFDNQALITESRQSPAEFFGSEYITYGGVVDPRFHDALVPEKFANGTDFIQKQAELWLGETGLDWDTPDGAAQLGEHLKKHAFFRNFILTLNNQSLSLETIAAHLQKIDANLAQAEKGFVTHLLESLLALVSVARAPDGSGRPFLDVRVQVWMRELARVVAEVARTPQIRFADDLKPEQQNNHLPLIHCRECGAIGWGAVKRRQDTCFNPDYKTFIRAFFANQPSTHFIFPGMESRGKQQRLDIESYVCEKCLYTGNGAAPPNCPNCGVKPEHLIPALIVCPTDTKKERLVGKHTCPGCEAPNSLTIVGSRSASLLSVVIGQIFNSVFCCASDKKILAFSDSVQDAAHRAGFFGARTYQFNFRTAIQNVVKEQSGPIPLPDFSAQFIEHWEKRLPMPEFIATFLAPSMAWMEDYDKLKQEGRLPSNSSLIGKVKQRIEWEIWSEYGFRSRIGRTLEKTGSSIATPAIEVIHAATQDLIPRWQNEIGGWLNLDTARVIQFFLGFFTQMRTRGAVDFSALRSYIENWGNNYLINKNTDWMPNFGSNSRTPVFLTTKRGTRFDTLLASGATESWYQDWLRRALDGMHSSLAEYTEPLFTLLFKNLTERGLLHQYEGLSHPVWSIPPGALQIEIEVDQYQCDTCGFTVSAPASQRAHWQGMPCLRFRCKGHYALLPDSEDYYRNIYATGEVRRIFTGEHTGLLKRDVLDDLEKRFIHQNVPAAENVLSCTPTLEMGINIGDLSTVLLCSVPPSQANYLQRVGRSGRRDGNAYNFVMAQGDPHNLYFFEEPAEMLAGAIDPPGIFLNAPAVLERQFVAYCFDRWIESGVGPEAIPKTLGMVLSNLDKSAQSKAFPYNWLQFIDIHRTAILERFEGLFKDTLSEASSLRLKDFVEGSGETESSLLFKVVDRLTSLKQERDSLRKRVQQITRSIRTKETLHLKDLNTDEELKNLNREKASLIGIINHINSKDPFNFFTDEGLLPNYAFPEAGIQLRSIIYRKKQIADKKGNYDTRIYEYQRPAQTAIQELAPANSFYAEGRKVTIDRINLDLAKPEEWRFCDQCSYAVLEAINTHVSACPKCGSLTWADAGQKRWMLKLRQVEASTSERESRVDDAHENREPSFYTRHMLVTTEPMYIEKAYKIDSDQVPFGFEFLRKVDFKEINYGLGGDESETLEIAGKPVSIQGFTVCKHCGKVKQPDKPMEHTLNCASKQSNKDPLIDCLYLYRQFTSEAIRILMPITTFGSEVKSQSFIASLFLGLKKKFKGRIDHLSTTVVEEPAEGGMTRKQYLVLYDRIPGGTGYLKELMQDKEKMMELLSLALQTLKDCRCHSDSEKDGCYRCLYMYRVSRDMAKISRNEAIQLLTAIVACKDRVIETDTVSTISVNSLFDSELEARFIEALRRGKPKGNSIELIRDVVNGKPGWHLRMEDTAYRIEPQVNLGEAQGVSIPSKADFVFYPEKREQGLPIAVFTDGFQFHADIKSNHLRIGEDLAQRMAIVRSGKYWIWSLTWQDVESQFESNGKGYFTNYLNHSPFTLAKLLSGYDDTLGTKTCSTFQQLSPFEAFFHFLNSKNRSLWRIYAFLQAVNGTQTEIGLASEEWIDQQMRQLLETPGWNDFKMEPKPQGSQGEWYYKRMLFQDEMDRPRMALWVANPASRMQQLDDPSHLCLLARLFDDEDIASHSKAFKEDWNGFLNWMNFMQFLPKAKFITTQGIRKGCYTNLCEAPSPVPTQVEPGEEANLRELLELTDPVLQGVLNQILQDGKLPPEPGFELSGPHGEVIATAELAWPVAKIALLLPGETVYQPVFEAQGWRIVLFETIIDRPEAFVTDLPNREKE